MNAYQFIVKMKDYASSGLKNIARSAGIADKSVDRLRGAFRSAVGGIRNYVVNAHRAAQETRKLRSEARKAESGFGALKRALAPIFATAAIVGFTSKVIDARAEHEKFQAVLTNTFQSADVGEGALAMLTDFAAKTPFQLNELTGSFIKLVNRGILPTRDELTNMGDLASSQGKSFDQLTEALLDAGTGEFERLKEFGIKASKSGDKVTVSFKDRKDIIDSSAESMKKLLLEYGKMPGVAGSMEAESKTLGGQISNLKDQWNRFLVAVGGEGSGLLTGFIELVSKGIAFLSDHLPQIFGFFDTLWSYISPVVVKLKDFVKAAFGIDDAGSVLDTFGNIINGVLLVVDYLTTGLGFLIDVLTPFAPYILAIAAAWTVWNYAIGVYNALLLVSPTTWIIIGIMALITIIGMAVKYTNGWGESWKALVKIFGLAWDNLKADFNYGVESFKTGFKLIILSGENAAQKIIGRFTKVGEAIKMALNGDFSGAWSKAFETVNTKAEEEMKKLGEEQRQRTEEWLKGKGDRAKQIKEEWGKVGITVDTEGIKNDFQALKKKFSGVGSGETGTSAYDNYLANHNGNKNGKEGNKDGSGKTPGESIVSGGTKHTNINITIQKLQDDTKIYVSSTEQGLSGLGEKVQEMLLRAVNSVNQMQTA